MNTAKQVKQVVAHVFEMSQERLSKAGVPSRLCRSIKEGLRTVPPPVELTPQY